MKTGKQPETGVARAARLFESGDLRRAEQAAKAVSAAAPAQANQILAGIALKRGDLDTAFIHASAAAEAAPGNARLLLNLATIEFALKRPEDALRTFEKAAALAPRDFEAQLGYGKMLVEKGRLDDAVAQFHRAHSIAPHPRAKGPMADALFRLERYDEAEKWALGAIAAGLDTAELICLVGKINLAQRRYKKAFAAFDAALKKDPRNTDALMGLSCAKARMKDLIAAREATRRYLELRPAVRIGAMKPAAQVAIVHPIANGCFRKPHYGDGLPAGGNFPSSLQSERLQFHHYFAPFTGAFPGPAEGFQADLVLSNLVNAEFLRGDPNGLARGALESFGAPVINGVEAALSTSREANYERFKDASAFRFPRTIAVQRQGESARDAADYILNRVPPPLILRPPQTQEGVGARLVSDPDALVAQIAEYKEGTIYAIEYFECADDEGVARRYRCTHVDGEWLATNMHAVRGWNAHGDCRVELNWLESNYWREEVAFLEDPDRVLGFDRAEVFSEIASKTALDIYGVDFGVARTGEVVIFEVNASMAFTSPKHLKMYPYIAPYRDKVFGRIDDYLYGRAMEARAAS